MSERWLFALTLWVVHEAVFFTVWAAYGLAHRRGFAPSARVVQGKAPKPEVMRRAVSEVLVSHVLFLPIAAYAIFPAWRAMGGSMTAPWPSLYEVAWQVVACMVIQDTLFYWSHRALHTKRLFRAIHRRHHDFRYVRGVAAEYAHPVETAFNLLSMVAGPILLASHPLTFMIWAAIRVGETVEAHSGYAFTTIASRHAYHHLYAARGCLGSFFGIWDRLMGTDRHWTQWRRDQPHR